ncbi:hypothetical protein [Luteolibacter sp. LG18]|uniref:hypothetical protein n=1 Tax=Luteolibacter sp. LG18 TaxID=2819286 RepID=UPI002B31B314|nr:hypothetical protein llg_01580 [Luteolibacter sp. LG18]
MSALPQRKKSAEEIAKLREEMGLPSAATNAPAEAPKEDVSEPEPPRPKPAAKAVRSLRRSERQPAPEVSPASAPAGSSAIPARRHSERELDRMRRQEAMTALSAEVPPAVAHLKKSLAHPALIALGYALAFGGGVGAFPVALYIALKKPYSRHHAGLMVMIAVLVVAFGALYLFPNLNPVHAS